MRVNSHYLLKKRLEAAGGDQAGRMRREKLKSLLGALDYSEQAETLVVDGKEHRAILNKNKQKMDYDDKNISIPYGSGFKVGTLFHWIEDDSDWIVYLREGQDAYFTGVCRKATYTVRWKDEYNVYHSLKAAIRGPVETKIVSEMKAGLSYDSPNHTLYCIIPSTEHSLKLKRYSKVSVDGKIWTVTVSDSITEPGVIELQLLEDYINKIEDEELIKPSEQCEFVPSDSIKIITSLDGIEKLERDEPFQLWLRVEKDGEIQDEVSKSAKFTILNDRGVISDGNMLTPLVDGNIEIIVEVPQLCYDKTFVIPVSGEVIPPAVSYEIYGDDKVKSFGTTTYSIKRFIDGLPEEMIDGGKWQYKNNDKLFTVKENNSNEITFAWVVGNAGKVKLEYILEDVVIAEKNIKVESLI